MNLDPLTKEDTVALWYAVQAYDDMVRAMLTVDGIKPAQITAERARLLQAKRALRKVNSMRKNGVRPAFSIGSNGEAA